MPERKNNHEPHSWVQSRLSAYMDNQLPSLERVKVERHLRECSQCEHTLASLQWTVSLLKQVPAPPLPRSFVLPVPKESPRAPLISLSLLRLATALATLLLITLVGIDAIMQFGGAAAPASLSQRVAIAPTAVAAQPQAAEPGAPTQAAKSQAFGEGASGPTSAPAAQPTPAPTTVPPVVAPLPATAATAAPPAVAPKPTSPPAATSAPAATAAPAAGALQSQTGAASRPAVRSSVVQGSPTPSAPIVLGKGGGNDKSSQDSAAATAAPLQSQPRSLDTEPTEDASTSTEPPASPLPTPTVVLARPTATPRQEALAQPTRAPVAPPTVAPSSQEAFPISPLRIAELGVLFVAVFLGVLTLLLRR